MLNFDRQKGIPPVEPGFGDAVIKKSTSELLSLMTYEQSAAVKSLKRLLLVSANKIKKIKEKNAKDKAREARMINEELIGIKNYYNEKIRKLYNIYGDNLIKVSAYFNEVLEGLVSSKDPLDQEKKKILDYMDNQMLLGIKPYKLHKKVD